MRRVRPTVAVAGVAVLAVAGLVAIEPPAVPTALNAAWTPSSPGSLTNALAHALPWLNPKSAPPKPHWHDGITSLTITNTDPLALLRGNAAEPALYTGADSSPSAGNLPYEQFQSFPLSEDTTAKVDLGNGNLILDSTDASLNTAGVPLSDERSFNSLGNFIGSFGGHWLSDLSGFDTGLDIGSSQTTYVGPSGNQETFTLSGSTWTPPEHFNATLTTGSGSPTLVMNTTGEKLTFNSSGWLTSDVNANGLGNTYTYNGSGQVTSVTEAAGRSFTITWGSSNGNTYISSIQDSAGRVTTYQHNSSGLLTEADSPGSYLETYGYDSNWRVAYIQASGPDTSTGVLVNLTYDSVGRVTAIKQGTVGSSTYARTTTFSGWGPSSTMTETDGNSHVTTWSINASNVPTGRTDPLGLSSSWTYNSMGYISGYIAPNSGSSTTTFNSSQLPTSATTPTGASTTNTYSTSSSCSGSGGNGYQPTCVTDASGNTTAYTYDSKNNVTATTDTTTSGTNDVTSATYATASGGCYTTGSGSSLAIHGLAGEVCSITNGNGNTTNFQYDATGDVTKVIPPSPLGSTSYTYDTLGRVTSMADGNGKTTTYTYNVRDQLLTTTYASGATLTQTWTPNGLESTSSQDANNSVTYSYDVLGNMTKQVNLVASTSATENYGHDKVGTLTSFTDPGGSVNYVYDADNRLTQLIEPSGSCTTSGAPSAASGCIKFSYDSLGDETLRQFPGGAQVATTRDESGRATRITAKDASGAVRFDKGYSYSLSGNDTTDVQSATSYVETGVPVAAVTTYTYDSQDHLTAATEKTSSGTANAAWNYAYDADGNRTNEYLTGNLGTAPLARSSGGLRATYNGADQLALTNYDGVAWTYDANGNLLQDGQTGSTYTWNDHGGLAGTVLNGESTAYSTYGTGNVTTTSRADSAQGATGYGNSDELGLVSNQRWYDRTPDGSNLGSRAGDGTRYYFVQDNIGSVSGLFDANGNYLGGYSYSPYGEPRYTTNVTATDYNRIRYADAYWDSSLDQYKLGSRYYDPFAARFTQVDPSGQEANAYVYAGDNPISNVDPEGTSKLSAAKVFWKILHTVYEKLSEGSSIWNAIRAINHRDLKAALSVALSWGVAALCTEILIALAPETGALSLWLIIGCDATGELAVSVMESLFPIR